MRLWVKRWHAQRAFYAQLEADRELDPRVVEIKERARSDEELADLLQRELGWEEEFAVRLVEITKVRRQLGFEDGEDAPAPSGES